MAAGSGGKARWLLDRKTARERRASFLLTQSRQGMPLGHSRQRFKLPITHSDIADYIGLTIETVSRPPPGCAPSA
jgi:CRP/FNR family transcriptional regulator